MNTITRALFIEPFASLSHMALLRGLQALFPDWQWTTHTLTDRQWKWRNRVGALQLSQQIDGAAQYDILITGSLINLTELLALAPNLQRARKVVYFHENQFAYPTRTAVSDSEKQIMYNSITTAYAADVILFNSEYNRSTFIAGATRFLKALPLELDRTAVMRKITDNSQVFGIPVITAVDLSQQRNRPPLILWNHRWEHDKQPELFFGALFALADAGIAFSVAVAGEEFGETPEIFTTAQERLGDRIVQFGHIGERSEYEKLLARSDIVVSSANQEFFGISIIEAVANGAIPVLPDALSYPELFPAEYRFDPAIATALQVALRRRLHECTDDCAPARAEIARLAQPYLLAENTASYRDTLLAQFKLP